MPLLGQTHRVSQTQTHAGAQAYDVTVLWSVSLDANAISELARSRFASSRLLSPRCDDATGVLSAGPVCELRTRGELAD